MLLNVGLISYAATDNTVRAEITEILDSRIQIFSPGNEKSCQLKALFGPSHKDLPNCKKARKCRGAHRDVWCAMLSQATEKLHTYLMLNEYTLDPTVTSYVTTEAGT